MEVGRKNKGDVHIQGQLVRNILPSERERMPMSLIKASRDRLRPKLKAIIIYKDQLDEISTKDKLAYVIKKHYGYGEFNIAIYGWYNNKKYDKGFKCVGVRCYYYKQNLCNRFKGHKIGYSCKHNQKISFNWITVAHIEIIENNKIDIAEQDYTYIWDSSKSKMLRFSKWFWRDLK